MQDNIENTTRLEYALWRKNAFQFRLSGVKGLPSAGEIMIKQTNLSGFFIQAALQQSQQLLCQSKRYQ